MQKAYMRKLGRLLADALLVLAGATAAGGAGCRAGSGQGNLYPSLLGLSWQRCRRCAQTGDIANWAPRIAQGVEVMAAHAINGYQGKSGYMPARGGFNSLTDEEVIAAVTYMAGESH